MERHPVTPKKPPDPDAPRSRAISGPADDWIRQFVKHFELNIVDCSRDVPPDAGVRESMRATASAVFATFLDSGMDKDAVLDLLEQVAFESISAGIAWSETLNHRRFELIDKEIEQSLTPAERIELVRLTGIMRNHVESELNLPIAGVQELHRKLLQLGASGEHD